MIIQAPLHRHQWAVHTHPARHKMIRWGRRAGKTYLGAVKCYETAGRGGFAWWVAPTYKLSNAGWRRILGWGMELERRGLATVRRADREVMLNTGGWIAVRSADDPQSLRSEGLDLVVLDEVSYMQETAWTEALRPALADRRGSSMHIFTPRGRNWVYRLEMQALSRDDWHAWHGPSSINPYLDPAEIEIMQEQMTERVYRQEILAEYVEGGGGVFRFVEDAAELDPQPAQEGHYYVMGIDWGRTNDFTVAVVLDITDSVTKMVHMDRWTGIHFELQLQRLGAIRDEYQPLAVTPEQNSMGMPLVERLVELGWPINPPEGFNTTNITKQAGIDSLALAFERGTIKILDDPIIKAELQAFDESKTPTGRIRYAAPEGMTDDIVMATMLAYTNVPVLEGPIAAVL